MTHDYAPFSFREGRGWFAVHTWPQSEFRAQKGLARLKYETFLPTERRWIKHARYKRSVVRPLLARYLFVSFDPNHGWPGILDTDGVCAILSSDYIPVRVPTDIVDALRTDQTIGEHDETTALARMVPGAPVRIMAGPLRGFLAELASVNTAKERADVFVAMLGKQCKVRLSLVDLRPAAAKREIAA